MFQPSLFKWNQNAFRLPVFTKHQTYHHAGLCDGTKIFLISSPSPGTVGLLAEMGEVAAPSAEPETALPQLEQPDLICLGYRHLTVASIFTPKMTQQPRHAIHSSVGRTSSGSQRVNFSSVDGSPNDTSQCPTRNPK